MPTSPGVRASAYDVYTCGALGAWLAWQKLRLMRQHLQSNSQASCRASQSTHILALLPYCSLGMLNCYISNVLRQSYTQVGGTMVLCQRVYRHSGSACKPMVPGNLPSQLEMSSTGANLHPKRYKHWVRNLVCPVGAVGDQNVTGRLSLAAVPRYTTSMPTFMSC